MKILTLFFIAVGVALASVLTSGRAADDGLPDDPAAVSAPLTPLSSAVQRLAVAIAAAEGFSVPGSVPNRNHNPGDLRVDTTGKGIGKDELGFIRYANDSDGWEALHVQVELMLTDRSHIYTSNMTITETSTHYTTTAQAAWASIVAQQLGVSTSTKLFELLT
jgi:hypothetical protein